MTTRVATTSSWTSAKSQSGAVSLDVPESLAVITLLCCSESVFVMKELPGALLSAVRGCGQAFDSWPGCLPNGLSVEEVSKTIEPATHNYSIGARMKSRPLWMD